MTDTYWWRGVRNWGDLLSEPLLAHYAGVGAYWASPEEAELLCVGSVVGHVDKSWQGHILGSGKLFEDEKVPQGARIWALRGPLTATGVKGSYALGDPGLLADELVPKPVKQHKLGILPHWSDKELTLRTEWDKFSPARLDPSTDPLTLIAQIGACEKLVTSSLHGLIVADAFGVPRRFEMASQLAREGGIFKHLDYSASVGHPFEIGITSSPHRFKINDCRDQLIDAFENYGVWKRSTGK